MIKFFMNYMITIKVIKNEIINVRYTYLFDNAGVFVFTVSVHIENKYSMPVVIT